MSVFGKAACPGSDGGAFLTALSAWGRGAQAPPCQGLRVSGAPGALSMALQGFAKPRSLVSPGWACLQTWDTDFERSIGE